MWGKDPLKNRLRFTMTGPEVSVGPKNDGDEVSYWSEHSKTDI